MRDVLAVIPARGGSKGIPRKNLVSLAGKPLIQWTIDAARAAGCVARIVVSTDDEEIAGAARALGADVPFLRPSALAADDTPGVDPILHCVERLGIDVAPWTLVLQPTSPLRTAADIDAARALANERDVDAVLGVTLVRQHAAWHKRVNDEGHVVGLFEAPATRQALPTSWCPNGAIYLCRTTTLLSRRTLTPPRTAILSMPGSRSVDIDVADDLVVASALLKEAS